MRKSLLCVLIACNLLILLWAAITAGGQKTQPRMLTPVDNPKQTVEDFFTCFGQERFDDCSRYIGNYSSFGADLSKELEAVGSSTEISAYLYENIIANCRASLIDPDDMGRISGSYKGADYSVDGTEATVTFYLTVFDTGKFSERLSELVKTVATDHKFKGEEIDSDEKAYALISEAFELIKEEPVEQFISTTQATVDLIYVDGAWKIEMDNAFAKALLGDITAYGGAIEGIDAVSGSDAEGSEQ